MVVSAGSEDGAIVRARDGFGMVFSLTQTALARTVAVNVTVELDKESRAPFFRKQCAMGWVTGRQNFVMPYHPKDSIDVLSPLGEAYGSG
ncbi:MULTISPECIES: hypothetical protein [unclassified Rhodococcus (in: high G+C Gram-positive bacteria)]|uniref:hypothetical protein n=1 Tax=unclassified Rhodococcus (in: high G+C Gram-positive bacteria) TaxID=192944 RepID=UPI00163A7D24|nr:MULTISPECIES: hypothetical protein [unclassified Rhodococcus (in: high G+C Gram-positive bacteria)]MBC2644226.1 hypothetical protein [Rhodococcus sp. 3A]MBC2891035.1 hypothetical protein [Rhodococcus sp. 4CII]